MSAVWLTAAILLSLLAAPTLFRNEAWALTDIFFLDQDAPVLAAVVLCAALLLLPGARTLLRGFCRSLAASWRSPWKDRDLALLLAGAVALAAWLGARLTPLGYPLSMDEFMANFDAVIFAHGAPMARLPAMWRPYAQALQPMFMLDTRGGGGWASSYLPVNAAFRGLGRMLGVESLVGPSWAALSVVALLGIARRLWPDRRSAATVAMLLLASSSQFLLTAMTSYAMGAHLALNLLWLWLFLRGGRLGTVGALVTGFLACGLHQLVFHPLFVAPFILELWLARKWRLAGFYTGSYALICLFWIFYPTLAMRLVGLPAGPPAAAASGFAGEVIGLISGFRPAALSLMAKNLIRFMTWQNPLAVILALLAMPAALRIGGNFRALVLGPLLTVGAVLVLIAYQGYGWGYRYLHGFLGSVSLLAALQWLRISDRLDVAGRRIALAGIAASAAACAALLAPLRIWQASAWITPYERASAEVAGSRSPVVVIDEAGIWFARHLVRNDPFLRRSPVVLSLQELDQVQARALCGRGPVRLFDRRDAAAAGIRTFQDTRSESAVLPLRAILASPGCRPAGRPG